MVDHTPQLLAQGTTIELPSNKKLGCKKYISSLLIKIQLVETSPQLLVERSTIEWPSNKKLGCRKHITITQRMGVIIYPAKNRLLF